jgi:hypothetical protein
VIISVLQEFGRVCHATSCAITPAKMSISTPTKAWGKPTRSPWLSTERLCKPIGRIIVSQRRCDPTHGVALCDGAHVVSSTSLQTLRLRKPPRLPRIKGNEPVAQSSFLFHLAKASDTLVLFIVCPRSKLFIRAVPLLGSQRSTKYVSLALQCEQVIVTMNG